MKAVDNDEIQAEEISLGLLLDALSGNEDARWFSIARPAGEAGLSYHRGQGGQFCSASRTGSRQLAFVSRRWTGYRRAGRPDFGHRIRPTINGKQELAIPRCDCAKESRS
ncbi:MULTISPECIES: hypothetical protein [Rhizobium]|uniref:Uncharacterized protein n=1 Tax=Rhizobium phaseoli TaxID=396 RepID=A0A192TCF7_9HYPH|nr:MULTISPECIES: hypothetical protein [Rhizobium]ANL40990.1 hypothetical protein AMC88_CH02613 [Rhizobium phaseoli]ANL53725.1 hypothetical protein AMC86_CH02598 [Rhizobium phaseoli]ANL59978.1 hypothetical protein AMC85_CH02612 [Rhizobium phaseoli]ANL85370.1 hypothetical protein AMC81_CH02609 [Rhizobium phaseoli]ANL91879.1 hypothetical protein AMC80_CH02611 [Rhizobium phaseoli]